MESKDCTEKSLIAVSEASHLYILSGQKLINKTENEFQRWHREFQMTKMTKNDKNDIKWQKW